MTSLLFLEISEAYDLLMGKDPEDEESVKDAHEITESGFPKVSSIAYAKNILGVEPSATADEVNEAYRNGHMTITFMLHLSMIS